ncbi:MAG TPA: glycosyltransferase family 4 protein [Terriglobia bacterium]|jgi:glycosyltransferase involved in cell wall biosynthesis
MKPRILIISPVTPYPVHHGAGSAIYGYIRALRDAFDISFVGFCPPEFQAQAQAGLDLLCRRAHLFKAPPARKLDAFSPTPFLFSNLQSDDMRQAVDRILKEERPDLVQVEYLGMAGYAEGAKVRRIVRAHVLEWWHYYLNWRRVRGFRARLENLFWSLDSVRHNKKTLETFDWVLVTSQEESLRARELVPRARAEHLPFILMDCEHFVPAPQPPREPQVLFVGFLPHTPNTDALCYFLREEWPLIRRQEPRARLVVAGEGASNALRGLMDEAGVDYRGYVEDLRDLYRQSRVYIAPINSGGGIRTKIVEAMAAGVPVVCNSFAPLGLDLTPDRHVVVRDRAQDSAEAILRLLRDDSHWSRLRAAGRALVENSFSLQRVGPRIAQRYLEFFREAA